MRDEKLLPHDYKLERSLLATILNSPTGTALNMALEHITAEAFYSDENRKIFEILVELHGQKMYVDMTTLIAELNHRQILDQLGGVYNIAQLDTEVVYHTSAQVDTYAVGLKYRYIQRELIKLTRSVTLELEEAGADVDMSMDFLEQRLYDLRNKADANNQVATGASAAEELLMEIEAHRHKPEALTGVTSGFSCVDRCTNGWQPNNLIILAARPSVGKTAMALNLVRAAAMSGTPVLIFSLEMSKKQLIRRMLADLCEVSMDDLNRMRLDASQMKKLQDGLDKHLKKYGIYIDDGSALNMFEIRARSRRYKQKYGVGLIVVDYLQLISGDSGKSENREREISKISRNLKETAKDLELPIIALSQLSRKSEDRADRQPKLSDLRESGAIEQDADLVMFLYRPNKEDIIKDPSLEGTGLVNIAKHRDGSTDEWQFYFQGHYQRWCENNPILGSSYQPVTPDGNGNWRPIQLDLKVPDPETDNIWNDD